MAFFIELAPSNRVCGGKRFARPLLTGRCALSRRLSCPVAGEQGLNRSGDGLTLPERIRERFAAARSERAEIARSLRTYKKTAAMIVVGFSIRALFSIGLVPWWLTY